MTNLHFQTFEGGASLSLPKGTTQQSISLLIQLLQMQQGAFPSRQLELNSLRSNGVILGLNDSVQSHCVKSD